jgi:hypothetical protein
MCCEPKKLCDDCLAWDLKALNWGTTMALYQGTTMALYRDESMALYQGTTLVVP